MTPFEINENLKEDLVLNHKATYAITTFYKGGDFLISEPFYETVVMWHNGADIKTMKNAVKTIIKYKEDILKISFMSEIILDFYDGIPYLIWNVY